MPRIAPFLFTLLCAWSCQSPQKAKTEAQSTTAASAPVLKATLERDPRKIGPEKSKEQHLIEADIYKINASENPLYGYWVGAFGKNKINIALAYTEGDSIFGHSVCAGNFRPIKGTIEEIEEGIYNVEMREPGDDQYDGAFHFTIDLNSRILTGSWAPYQNTTSPKNYELGKRTFVYNPYAGDYPETSTTYLEVPDVENLLPEEIELRRNEIYARHGYSFQNLKIRRIFEEKDWYIPMSVDIRDQLTEVEAHNIDLMYNYEDYYEEYYDGFGR